MDRELDVSFRRRLIGRRVALGGGTVALLVAVLLFLPGWLRPSIARERIRTGLVDRGAIEGIVEASGTVIPAFEGVLSIPFEARVEKILKRPGEAVREGEEILKLDTSMSRLQVEKLEDQLAKKANEQEQLRLSLEKSLSDLRGRIESQKLDVEALQYRLEQNRKLRVDGLVSAEALKAVEVEARKAQIELSQLEESVRGARRSTDAQLQGLELDLRTLRKERDEARRQLALGTTRSDRAGILTWVVPREGATVPRGEVIARISDLDSFRVEAMVSDIHSPKLRPGLPVRVKIGGEDLPGRLGQIYPTIENGAVRLAVDLDDSRNPRLRNNLNVDVLIVVDSRASALRVPRGTFSQNGADGRVFVVRGERAERRDVRFGISGYDHYEVLAGLEVGDEVILSDMSDYTHLEQVNLK